MDAAAPRAKRRGGRWRLLPERGTLSLFELALLAVCVALVAVPLPQYLQDVVIQTFLWAGLALAWNIAGGFAGLISFGHAAFFGVGAYAEAIVFTHIGIGGGYRPFAVVPLIGLGVAVAAIPVAIVFLRVRGATFAIASSPSLHGPSGFSLELIRTASGSIARRAPPIRRVASCAMAYSL